MKALLKFTVFTLAVLVGVAHQTPDWEQNPYDTEAIFKDIPEQINMKKTRFGFRMTNWFITGIHRGLYNDTSLVVNSDCFGD